MIRIQIVTEKWDPVSAAIRYTTRSWASHAEFVWVEKGWTLGARARSFRDKGGVLIRPCALDRYTKVEQFVLNSDRSAFYLDAAWRYAATQIGMPYAYQAVLAIQFDRSWSSSNPNASFSSWFCSELVAASLMKVGFPILSTRPSDQPYRITPRDLLLSRQLVYVDAEK
jgi:hypothetical protein